MGSCSSTNSADLEELPASIQMTRVLGVNSLYDEESFLPANQLLRDPDALLQPRKKAGDDSFLISLKYGFAPKFGSPQYQKFVERKTELERRRKKPRPFEMQVVYQVRASKININPYDFDRKGYKINSTDELELLENNMAARNLLKSFKGKVDLKDKKSFTEPKCKNMHRKLHSISEANGQ